MEHTGDVGLVIHLRVCHWHLLALRHPQKTGEQDNIGSYEPDGADNAMDSHSRPSERLRMLW